jgi:RNA polymerase sigma-70 factor (TIGR02960 family)
MLGEVHDADDALQETLLRAWRAIDRFEPRSPVRAWLYRIATNVCLTELTRRGARPVIEPAPTKLGPYPDRLLATSGATEPGPEVHLEAREHVELAFVAAVQLLPARQRAVLVLRDVLDFPAGEAARILDTSVPAVNSALQRARSGVERDRRAGRVARTHAPASSDVERGLARRFGDAWRAADVDGIVRLLTDDALLTMPPEPSRVIGSEAIADFLVAVPAAGRLDRIALRASRANCQPALAAYLDARRTGVGRPYALLVLSIEDDAISSVCRFGDVNLFTRLGLPASVAIPL